jgi:hypothetical protein
MIRSRPCRRGSSPRAAAGVASETAIVRFTPDLLAPVRAFCERYWSRPATDDYYDWRYLQSQSLGRTLVAMRGGECLGTLSALRKPYRIAGRPTPCLEVFDWHVLPELRGSGVGIRLMRAMMREPARIISVGGTPDAQGALPLMRWSRIAVARRFELPLDGEAMTARLQRRARLPAAIARIAGLALEPLSAAWFAPRSRRTPAGAMVRVATALAPEVAGLHEGDTGCGIAQAPSPGILDWLARGPWSGRFEFLTFSIAGRLRGWAMTRVYRAEQGLVGALVELFAPQPDVATYTWMVSEAAVSLNAAGAHRVKASASCPVLQAALVANHFRAVASDAPVHTWPPIASDELARAHFTLNHADGPFRPFDVPPGAHGAAPAG